jgi:glycosyltransferase involved in cell wall biosynthesis
MERRSLAAAEGVVTLTKAIWPTIKQWEGLRDNQDVAHEVIPCCADLELFKFSQEERERRRTELGLAGRFVVIYSGSIDGWYLTEQMADFFATVLRRRSEAHALWLTPNKHERIRKLMQERGIPEGRYTAVGAAPRDVSSYLSASDAGLAFIKPCFSKVASSPTKYAEYLACGLPLIINSGVGDADSLVIDEGIGALVHDFTEDQYEEAAAIVESLVGDRENTRRRTRAVAERCFDVRTVGVQRYSRLYERIFADSLGVVN